jgi:uncharacterized protein Yka (UPF0111/DUF47 family)
MSTTLDNVIRIFESLNKQKHHQLHQSLQKYEHAFDGILRELNTDPSSLQLMDNKTPIVSQFMHTDVHILFLD